MPFRHALVLQKPQAPPIKGSENLGQILPLEDRQCGCCFAQESVAQGRIVEVGIMPPCDNPLAALREHGSRGQPIPLFVAVYPRITGRKIPKIATWPCRPRQAVIHIQFGLAQSPGGPDTG